VPCGVSDVRYGVTSLVDLGHVVTLPEVDMVLRREFEQLFGATRPDQPAIAAPAAQSSGCR
jgi:lipoyl(octanoyl) transferase